MELLLGSKKFINGLNQDNQIEIQLDSNIHELNEDILTNIVDEINVFNTERAACNNYLIYGKVETLIDPYLLFSKYEFNDVNYEVSLGYVYGYEVLPEYKNKINNFIENMLFIDDSSNFIKDDVVLLYADSENIFVKKVIDSLNGVVTIDSIPSGITLSNYSLIPSSANYKRLYKPLLNSNYLKFYEAGFSQNIYGDKINLFNSFKNINLSGLTDVLGLPISELFFRNTKKNLLISSLYINSKDKEINTNVIDIINYDLNNLLITNVEDTNYYFIDFYLFQYNPWFNIKYKCYSNDITHVTDTTSFDYPDYSFIFGDGDILYKKLLPVGYIEEGNNGVNYPFINNIHYLYNDIKIFIRRYTPIYNYTDLVTDEDVVYNTDLINSNTGGERLC